VQTAGLVGEYRAQQLARPRERGGIDGFHREPEGPPGSGLRGGPNSGRRIGAHAPRTLGGERLEFRAQPPGGVEQRLRLVIVHFRLESIVSSAALRGLSGEPTAS
jgi:hypothetical protein